MQAGTFSSWVGARVSLLLTHLRQAMDLLLCEQKGDIDLKPLEEVMNGRGGAKLLASQLIRNKQFLQSKEVRLREHVMAWTKHKPDVSAAVKMESFADLLGLKDKILLWKKCLLPGLLK